MVPCFQSLFEHKLSVRWSDLISGSGSTSSGASRSERVLLERMWLWRKRQRPHFLEYVSTRYSFVIICIWNGLIYVCQSIFQFQPDDNDTMNTENSDLMTAFSFYAALDNDYCLDQSFLQDLDEELEETTVGGESFTISRNYLRCLIFIKLSRTHFRHDHYGKDSNARKCDGSNEETSDHGRFYGLYFRGILIKL